LKIDERQEREIKGRITRATATVSQQQKLIAQLKKDGLPVLHAERYVIRLQARLLALKATLPEGQKTYI
jgi:hypothetical protein